MIGETLFGQRVEGARSTIPFHTYCAPAPYGGTADAFERRATAPFDPLLTKTQSDLPCRVVIEMASDLSNRAASTALRDVAFSVMMSDVHVD